jgi:serine/threonine protein kinase
VDRSVGKRLAAVSVFSGLGNAGFRQGELINKRYLVRHRSPGGDNIVYLCFEMGTWDYVALKFPTPRDGDKTGYKRWQIFSAEVQNWAGLPDHPHVVRCLYAGVHEHSRFLVLEWVGAPDQPEDPCGFLGSVQRTDPGAWLAEFVRLAREICEGLAHIHAHGILHGDLKPANVLIDKAGRAKITDLGTGSLTAARESRARRNASAGIQAPPGTTMPYIAPELWKHPRTSVQTDIYALGCLLFEMAASQPPFVAQDQDDAAEWSRLHREQPPPVISALPDQVRKIIADCLAKKPAHRPATAAEVGARLANVALSLPRNKAPDADEPDPGQDKKAFMPDMRARNRVSLMSSAGRTEDAIEQVSIAIRDHMTSGFSQLSKHITGEPDDSLALVFNERGALTARTEDWIKATGDFITAIRLDPRLAVAYANLGTNYERMTLPVLAIIALNRAIELDPEDQRLYLQRARFLSGHGWHASAHEDYKRAVEITPDDPDACYGMADSLAALERYDEAFQYRRKGVEPSRPDDGPHYVGPVRRSTRGDILGETMTAHFKREDGDHEAALAAYTTALAIAPWDTRILYERGETRLAAGNPSGAVEDLAAFLEHAGTTHPHAQDARGLLRQAQAAAGNTDQQGEDTPDEDLPDLKSPGYIAARTQGRCEVMWFISWLPLSPGQRLALLDMLHAGDPDRQLKAARLLWRAYDEVRENRRSGYEQMISDLPGDTSLVQAGHFAAAEIAGELAVRNGYGVPVLLTEVRLSPNPLRHVQFSSSAVPLLGWASSGAAGVWRVVPAVEEAYEVLDEPRLAPQFTPDDSSYLMLAERELLVFREEGMLRQNVRDTEGGSILAACFCGNGTLAIGASTGWVAFTAGQPGENDAHHVQLTKDGDHDLRLWPVTDDAIAAFSGGNLYEIQVPLDVTGHYRVRQAESFPRPASARFMAASGPWVAWAVSPEELLLTRLDQPDMNVRLGARDGTGGGLKSAAVSADGSVVAAVCGSFLHVWRATTGETDYGYLPMTPQPFGECVAVSADGRYIATGTDAGSIAVYVTRIAEEP